MDALQKEPPPFRLDRADVDTLVWRKLRQHLEDKREGLRRRNDDPNLDPVKTAMLRGRIHEITKLLALGETQAPATGADADDGE